MTNVSVQDLRDMVSNPDRLLKSVRAYSGIKGSSGYWHRITRDLREFICQLPICPHLFVTLSFADTYNEQLDDLILQATGKERLPNEGPHAARARREKQIAENPMITTMYFMQRQKAFNDWLKKALGVKDFFW